MTVKSKVQDYASAAISSDLGYYFFEDVTEFHNMYEPINNKPSAYRSSIIIQFMKSQEFVFSTVDKVRTQMHINNSWNPNDIVLSTANANKPIFVKKDLKLHYRKMKLKRLRSQICE